jgi:hypothetical protein
MKKNKRSIEKTITLWSAGLSALVAFSISIADILGIEKVKFLQDRIPIMVLLVTGIILGTLTLILQQLFIFNEHRVSLRAQIRALIKKNALEHLNLVLGEADHTLMSIVGSEITELVEQVPRIIHEKEFVLYETAKFRRVYMQTLEKFKGAKFLATSLPYKEYFWIGGAIEDAHKKFIEEKDEKGRKGEISRIFFLKDPEEINVPEIRQILEAQCKMNVKARVANLLEVGSDLKKLVFADTEKRIGWEVETIGHKINKVIITTDAEKVSKYVGIFETLKESPGVTEYPPQVSDAKRAHARA